jgi:hypothetical protein
MERYSNIPITKLARTYLGVEVRSMKPTGQHRPAVWENMLGTVFAMNDDHKVQYFDYDHESALAFAGVTADRDPRLARADALGRVPRYDDDPSKNPRPNQTVLWITR